VLRYFAAVLGPVERIASRPGIGLGVLGSTRPPAQLNAPDESRVRGGEGGRRPATETYGHTAHTAHHALLVSLID
jgi:hypothetical protein